MDKLQLFKYAMQRKKRSEKLLWNRFERDLDKIYELFEEEATGVREIDGKCVTCTSLINGLCDNPNIRSRYNVLDTWWHCEYYSEGKDK